MFILNPITEELMRQYADHLELLDPIPIGFTGVASQEISAVYSNEVDAVSLIFGFSVNFEPGDAEVWIRSTNPQYEWNVTTQNGTPGYMPISAVAGTLGQVLPVLPLVMPFKLNPNGKLELRFRNASSGAITGGKFSIRRLKLVNPV